MNVAQYEGAGGKIQRDGQRIVLVALSFRRVHNALDGGELDVGEDIRRLAGVDDGGRTPRYVERQGLRAAADVGERNRLSTYRIGGQLDAGLGCLSGAAH